MLCGCSLVTVVCLLPFGFFFSYTPPTEIYTLSLHDALPIFQARLPTAKEVSSLFSPAMGRRAIRGRLGRSPAHRWRKRSEEHTSELQSLRHLVCRLLLEKKKKQKPHKTT